MDFAKVGVLGPQQKNPVGRHVILGWIVVAFVVLVGQIISYTQRQSYEAERRARQQQLQLQQQQRQQQLQQLRQDLEQLEQDVEAHSPAPQE